MLRRSSIVMLLLVSVIGLGRVGAQEEPYNPVIDPANFVEGVNNPFFPLIPGTIHIYEGVSGGAIERIEVTVTSETREILGVTCVVVRDTVWQDDEMVEDTFDWYAQDKDGNVWYMGEDTKEYEGGAVVSTEGSWEAGVDGALPGVVMWGQPQTGEPYRQEYYPGEAEDMAEVLSLIAPTSGGGFLTTREWTPLEPGYAEHKYYVAGIGLVLEVVTEGGEGWIELVETRTE
jgi:hypothetical protein